MAQVFIIEVQVLSNSVLSGSYLTEILHPSLALHPSLTNSLQMLDYVVGESDNLKLCAEMNLVFFFSKDALFIKSLKES